MIEITHEQAQRTIRKRLDGQRLPEAQWAVLQAHLEGCAACRAYRDERLGLERGIASALRERWSPRDLPLETRAGLGAGVVGARRQKTRLMGLAARGALGLLALLGLVYAVYSRANAPETASVPPAAAQVATLTPPAPTDEAPAEDTFRGVIAYAGIVDGNAEIMLVNHRDAGSSGTEITNLTNHPAQDIEPVWSPDGEWIVFLSNRNPDGSVGTHFELYAVTVAGTRLTRLTHAPDIAWKGPLSWSSDGYMIALTGTRISTGAGPFVYLVPVGIVGPDGSSEPRALAHTRGVPGPLRFSPTSPLLIYTQPDETGGLMLYHLREQSYYPLTRHESGELKLKVGLDAAFDWLPNGWQVGYLARGRKSEVIEMFATPGEPEPLASLRLTTNLMLDAASRSDDTENMVIFRERGEDSLRGAAITAYNGGTLAAYLTNTADPGCWQVQIQEPSGAVSPRLLRGFCVQGDLQHENWASFGEWLVVNGAPLGEDGPPGVYALRIPRDSFLRDEFVYTRIADALPAAGQDGALPGKFARPLVRPSSRYTLDINIVPVSDDEALLAAARPPRPSYPPPAAPGTILYEVRADGRSLIYALPPGGPEPRLVARSGLSSGCPVLSPDGTRFAYLENNYQTFGVPAVVVAGLDGKIQYQMVASARPNSAGGLSMGCPVWSPDGKNLAWLSYRPDENFLKIVAVDEGGDWIFRINPPAQAAPAWLPDNRTVLFSTAQTSTLSPRIHAVSLPDTAARTRTLFDPEGLPEPVAYDAIIGMAVSQSGDLAFIQTSWMNQGTTALYELNAQGEGVKLSELPSSQAVDWNPASTLLEYLPDGSLIFTTRHAVDARIKTVVWIYDRRDNQRKPLAFLEDLMVDAALSPDGGWLVYSSDAGMYALDLNAARRDGQVTPALLVVENVTDVNWR